MGIFRNNTKKMVQEFKLQSEYYSNDFGREIKDSFEDLKSEFEDYDQVFPEFLAFVSEIKSKLSPTEVEKLEQLSFGLRHINHCAKNGIESMRVLSLNQKKHTRETLRLYEEFE